jgi:DNA invertase Pin-like site-specific DNA recombinase
VANSHAGIVLGLEVSRLTRNNADWHRLLELAALTQTLILDEDGVYDPAYFNDRLLLGLKGAMSEAELHILKARLQGCVKLKKLYAQRPTRARWKKPNRTLDWKSASALVGTTRI